MEEETKKKGNGSFGKTGRKKPNKPKPPKNRAVDREYLGLLSLLTTLPFHHLLSAERIYSSIISKSADAADIKIPSIFKSPAERLQMFQTAAANQTPAGSEAVSLARFLQLELFEIDFEGKEIEINWLVIFQDELQGCAEIYRAEMLLFKRLIYEQKENIPNPLIITNEKFQDHIDHELFDRLTGNETDRLIIKSLSAGYQISVTLFDDEEDSEEDESDAAILTDRIHDCISYYADYRDFERFEKIESGKSLTSDSPTGDADKGDDNSGRIAEKPEDDARDTKDKKDALRIFELRIGAYWRKWRQAARLADFDFDLLERLDDPPAIRFYELTKLLRLSTYSETTQTLPAELEINYKRFTRLMPLPEFHSEEEIKNQIQELTQPLIIAGYVEKFSYSEQKYKEKSIPRIYFKFCD